MDAAVEWLLKQQNMDGSIDNSRGQKVTMTALSLLALSIHYPYLPIYQR
jgi:squalene cyclase